jgi:hypothetical protein
MVEIISQADMNWAKQMVLTENRNPGTGMKNPSTLDLNVGFESLGGEPGDFKYAAKFDSSVLTQGRENALKKLIPEMEVKPQGNDLKIYYVSSDFLTVAQLEQSERISRKR